MLKPVNAEGMVAGSLAAGNLQNLVVGNVRSIDISSISNVDKLYASQRVCIFSCLIIPKQFFFS